MIGTASPSEETQMITDLDETLKQPLVNKVPSEPSEVDIGFVAPGRAWGLGIHSKMAEGGNINALQLVDNLPCMNARLKGRNGHDRT